MGKSRLDYLPKLWVCRAFSRQTYASAECLCHFRKGPDPRGREIETSLVSRPLCPVFCTNGTRRYHLTTGPSDIKYALF